MSSNARKIVEQLKSAKTTDFLGVMVCWTVPRVQIEYDKAEELIIKYGLNPKNITQPGSKKAFSRSVRRTAKENNDGEIVKKARRIGKHADTDVVGIVDEGVDLANDKLLYDQQSTIFFDKKDKTIRGHGDYVDEVRKNFDKFSTIVTDHEIRNFILASIQEKGAVPLRKTGGVYFVPKPQVDVVEKLNLFLEEVQVGKIEHYRIPCGKDENTNIWTSAKKEITDRAETIMQRSDKINSRPNALRKQTEKLEVINDMLTCYSDLCEYASEAEEVSKSISKISDDIAQRIMDLETDKSTAKKEKSEKKAAKSKAKEEAAKKPDEKPVSKKPVSKKPTPATSAPQE